MWYLLVYLPWFVPVGNVSYCVSILPLLKSMAVLLQRIYTCVLGYCKTLLKDRPQIRPLVIKTTYWYTNILVLIPVFYFHLFQLGKDTTSPIFFRLNGSLATEVYHCPFIHLNFVSYSPRKNRNTDYCLSRPRGNICVIYTFNNTVIL